MENNRILLSNCPKIKDRFDIPGNFSSVEGEYFIPTEHRTGFYKLNSSFNNNSDLRELLASLLLKKINVPTADILLVYDDERQENGCMSMNILKDKEKFLEASYGFPEYINKLGGLDRFIESDLYTCSSKYGFTPELLKERKDFLIKYSFISAFLGNTDIKTDNCQPIINENDGTIRNPEYYDMGVAFKGSTKTLDTIPNSRYFFGEQSDIDLLQEIYEKYSENIRGISNKIEMFLNRDYIKNLLSNEMFDSFDKETKNEIWSQLGEKIVYISQQNEILYGKVHTKSSFLTSLEEIESVTQKANISLIDKARNIINSIKSKRIGEINR